MNELQSLPLERSIFVNQVQTLNDESQTLVVKCLNLTLEYWIVKRRVGDDRAWNLASLEGVDEQSDLFEQEGDREN
ncbi:MAG: hypothetical protein KME10_21810 [Plectolyngbya sp. WJT66-NPBG17]|nr:hypothetical protein [Plectolyngbya sp. WJT66-NPBG17]